jgi:hypothetical protein
MLLRRHRRSKSVSIEHPAVLIESKYTEHSIPPDVLQSCRLEPAEVVLVCCIQMRDPLAHHIADIAIV